MARFDVSGLDEAVKWMERMGELTGDMADAMLKAGAKEVREAWRESAERHRHRDTGAMIESIGYARSPKTVDGVRTLDIYPRGKDHKGVRNAEKAFILHYGRNLNNGKRNASYWVDDADRTSDRTVVPAMLEVFDKYLTSKTTGGT